MRTAGPQAPGHLLQFGRYVAVGVVSAGIDVLMLWLLLAVQVARAPAVAVAMLAGMIANYALHRVYTFRTEQPLGLRSVLRYAAIVAGNYLLTLGIIEAGLRVGVGVMWGKILSLPVIAFTGFLLTRRFVF
jgi:putative flippase GtrA